MQTPATSRNGRRDLLDAKGCVRGCRRVQIRQGRGAARACARGDGDVRDGGFGLNGDRAREGACPEQEREGESSPRAVVLTQGPERADRMRWRRIDDGAG